LLNYPALIKFGEDTGPSSALSRFVLGFGCFSPHFVVQAAQTRMLSKTEAKFRSFVPPLPVKIKGGWARCLGKIEVSPTTQHLVHIWWLLRGRRLASSGKKKESSSVKPGTHGTTACTVCSRAVFTGACVTRPGSSA